MAKIETNTNKCPIGDVQAAIFDQAPLIAYEVNEKLETRPRYMMAKIKDGGEVDPHDDGTTLIMGRAFQAPLGYDNYNDPRPDQANEGGIAGQQIAQGDCGAISTKFGTTILETEKDQCNGVCVVDFAHGYRYRGSDDFDLEMATPERCIETLAKKERRFVAQYLEQEAESFSETAYQSYDHHLVNLAIERGGANSVVKDFRQGLPVLTAGGWDIGNDPRTDVQHITFYFCEHYRRQIVQRLRQFGRDGENYVADFDVTRDAYCQMYIAESLERTGDGGYIKGLGNHVRIDEKIFDEAHAMKGRAFAMSPDGKCRFSFNDEPIRGFLRPTGTSATGDTTYDFIRIYHLKNEPDEEMGVRAVYNPEYDYNCITCGGVEYPLMELIPHIHEDSFVRHGLTKGIGPRGVDAVGTNFEIQLLQGDALSSKDCPNFFQNKYRYAARHKMRWRDVYPEFSGFIMHRRRILAGYNIEADDDCLIVSQSQYNAAPEEIDNCVEEKCDNGCDLEVTCTTADNIISMRPCGSVITSYFGEPHVLTIDIHRDEDCATEAASVDYKVVDGTALAGTHFTVLDADGSPAPTNGTATWTEGEFGTKQVCIRIDAALATNAEFTICLENATGATLSDCVLTTVSIANRA